MATSRTRRSPPARTAQKKAPRRKPAAKVAADRRVHERAPIRLKVTYKSARALITEFTTCVSRGGCAIRSPRQLDVGTRFVFELSARGEESGVEIEGEVVRCDPSAAQGQWEIGIRYITAAQGRATLESVLEKVFAEHQYEKARRHPRVPVNLVAEDVDDPSRRYLIRDVSRGGLGLRLAQNESLPDNVTAGARVTFTIQFPDSVAVDLRAEVAWTAQARPPYRQGALGLSFPVLGTRQLEVLEMLVRLHRPERILVSFR